MRCHCQLLLYRVEDQRFGSEVTNHRHAWFESETKPYFVSELNKVSEFAKTDYFSKILTFIASLLDKTIFVRKNANKIFNVKFVFLAPRSELRMVG